jgi:hypothetical protein
MRVEDGPERPHHQRRSSRSCGCRLRPRQCNVDRVSAGWLDGGVRIGGNEGDVRLRLPSHRLPPRRPIFLHPRPNGFPLCGGHRLALSAPNQSCGCRVGLSLSNRRPFRPTLLSRCSRAKVRKHAEKRVHFGVQFLDPHFRSTAGEGCHVDLCHVTSGLKEGKKELSGQ